MSEALALKRALTLAINMGHDKVIFETDYLLLVKSISLNQLDLHDWRCRSIIHGCITALSSKVVFLCAILLVRVIKQLTFLQLLLLRMCTH